MRRDIHGILLLDKPLRVSSAQAVARAKHLFGASKAGHTGSLDPLATGFLAICFGEATKFGAHLLESDKTYRVEIRLGERTPSADRESEVCERRSVAALTLADIETALARFPRDYIQIPPMHSALKQDGKPLYEYARAGIEREREGRPVILHELTLLDWSNPDLTLEVKCSKGTYIRVLAEEIAAALDTVGHLAQLRRLSVTPFEAAEMRDFEALEAMDDSARLSSLLAPDAALLAWPALELAAFDIGQLRQGRTIEVAAHLLGSVRVYGPKRRFIGLGEITSPGLLAARRLIAGDANSI